MLIMNPFVLLFLCYFVQNYEIFISPIDSTPCMLEISNPCDGSLSKPFDDLQFAFAFCASNQLCLNDDIKFNLISQGSTYNFFAFRSSATGYNAVISPFEKLTGFIFLIFCIL